MQQLIHIPSYTPYIQKYIQYKLLHFCYKLYNIDSQKNKPRYSDNNVPHKLYKHCSQKLYSSDKAQTNRCKNRLLIYNLYCNLYIHKYSQQYKIQESLYRWY
jgi:hypothetical protein